MIQTLGWGGLLAVVLVGLLALFYAFVVLPVAVLRIRVWNIRRDGWSARMRIAVLTDIHAGEPFVGRLRIRRLVETINAQRADLIVLLGDTTPGHIFVSSIPEPELAKILSGLRAPQGVFAVMGNHDWWEDRATQAKGVGPPPMARAFESEGIPVLENDALQLPNGVWLAGLGDQLAFRRKNGDHVGVDDLDGTLAQVPDQVSTILLAHEPDIFPKVPDRVGLTLSGHTHGGQVRLFGWSPKVPSKYGNRFAYGHVREGTRDIVISAGIGCSILPLRIGVAPEVTIVNIA